jgi:predicted component of type VI protein secretion system
MKTTLFGSRITQVFVEVRPKSTLTIDFITPVAGFAFVGVVADFTLFIGVAAEFIGVAAEGWTVMKSPNHTNVQQIIMLIRQKCRTTKNFRRRAAKLSPSPLGDALLEE